MKGSKGIVERKKRRWIWAADPGAEETINKGNKYFQKKFTKSGFFYFLNETWRKFYDLIICLSILYTNF